MYPRPPGENPRIRQQRTRPPGAAGGACARCASNLSTDTVSALGLLTWLGASKKSEPHTDVEPKSMTCLNVNHRLAHAPLPVGRARSENYKPPTPRGLPNQEWQLERPLQLNLYHGQQHCQCNVDLVSLRTGAPAVGTMCGPTRFGRQLLGPATFPRSSHSCLGRLCTVTSSPPRAKLVARASHCDQKGVVQECSGEAGHLNTSPTME